MLETMHIDFYALCALFMLFPLASVFWYYWFICVPYANFPSVRVEPSIPSWLLRKEPLNYSAFQFLEKAAGRFEAEGLFVGWLGIPVVYVFGEEFVKMIMHEPSAMNKPKFYGLIEFAIGKGLLTSNGDCYKKQKKILTPAFHISAQKSYISVMNNGAKYLLKQLSELKGEPTDDTINIVSRCAFRILYETSLGCTERSAEEETRWITLIQKMEHFFIYRVFCPWLYSDFCFQISPQTKEARSLAKEGRNEIRRIVEDIKSSVISRQESQSMNEADSECYGREAKSFGEILVEQHLRDPTFSMEELISQVSVLIVAGYDTIAHGLMWCCFLLGLNPNVQDKVYEEVMSRPEENVQYEDLHKLLYLECVIKETLRLYQLPIIAKRVEKDIQCGKYLIPKHSVVAIFLYMLHRNPKIYPDPEKFYPERFLEKDSNIRPWNHIPFAEGIRPCPGKNFAMNEMKIVLSHLIRNFKIISLDRREDVKYEWCVSLRPIKNLRMQFIPRESL